jgi:threonine/homoserine/homoserine lactone efflux protein
LTANKIPDPKKYLSNSNYYLRENQVCLSLHLTFCMQFISTFLWGWLVSFTGQLPLGTLSITSTQIAVQENFRSAWKYALGVAVIEIIYLRLTLSGVNWIVQHQLVFIVLGWLTVFVFIFLAIASLLSARKQHGEKKAFLLNNELNRFFLGASMSALNPAQIPFWFLWGSICINNGVLQKGDVNAFNLFTIGAGVGTITGLALYMYGGNWLITKMNASNRVLNFIMSIIFFIAAFAQLYRMIEGSVLK